MNNKKIFVTRSSMPTFDSYIEAIKPLWETHFLTNMGKYHQELEEKLKQYLDVQELSLMVNGHMALELAIQAFQFPKDAEIITTPYTFISTTHAIIRNHLKPVFCDVKFEDGTIDENKIENLINERTVAILPVHVYGHVCNIEKIQEIADKYHLKVIYDAAHAFGVLYKEKGIGNYGDASIFSFHATKVFNTIEGGAVTFSDHKFYDKLYKLKNFGICNEELITEVGTNAKMNEFCAIMGLCNLKNIDKVIENRKYCYEYYISQLKNIKGINFFTMNSNINWNYAYCPILVNDNYKMNRNELYEYLKENQIYSRKYFYPLTSDQNCFKQVYKNVNLSSARWIAERILVLPLYEGLNIKIIDKIIDLIKN